MTEVTSLEISKELYAISGWGNPASFLLKQDWYVKDDDGEEWHIGLLSDGDDRDIKKHLFEHCRIAPAYDLGYLLRKIPKYLGKTDEIWVNNDGFSWTVGYMAEDVNGNQYWTKCGTADTPEDAAAKLAIELFRQGILNKE